MHWVKRKLACDCKVSCGDGLFIEITGLHDDDDAILLLVLSLSYEKNLLVEDEKEKVFFSSLNLKSFVFHAVTSSLENQQVVCGCCVCET